MKSGWIWISLLGLVLGGMILTQGLWGSPGYGGMMGYGHGPGMMGGGMGMMGVYPPQAKPIPPAEAKARLEAFARRFGPEARLKDFMAFSENYYAQVVGPQGEGLAEILADRYTGLVYPEPGPNMMWNTRWAQPAPAPRYDQTAAQRLAEAFLKGYLPGARVQGGQAFSGYHTFDFGRKEVEGMLSVNAYTGEVWVHTWHGIFLGGEH